MSPSATGKSPSFLPLTVPPFSGDPPDCCMPQTTQAQLSSWMCPETYAADLAQECCVWWVGHSLVFLDTSG